KQARLELSRFFVDAILPADFLAIAARGLGMQRAKEHEGPLLSAVVTGPAPQRLAAAEALARCGTAESVPALFDAVGENPDRMLEHAVIFALHHLAAPAALEKALADPHPRVQQAAMLLLDQPPRPKGLLKAEAVLARLAAADAGLRETSLSVLQKHSA